MQKRKLRSIQSSNFILLYNKKETVKFELPLMGYQLAVSFLFILVYHSVHQKIYHRVLYFL